ncbi:MAG TPA: fatty acid--CoA ligase family protein [bacterium]|nr:fatty acid--CoA ligase family protein [bacterium]HQI48037.1 fatty acid--CoA ligase family protein [bacterium]HQJ66505.1 fatty acid--CoA ligase family protein [bacterium]
MVILDGDFTADELSKLRIESAVIGKKQQVVPLSIDSVDKLIKILTDNQSWQLTLFTSGTTGIPKSITHTFRSLTRAVRISPKHTDDIWGFAYNPTHIAGLQVFYQALLNGNILVNLFNASRHTVLDLIKSFQITNISATPTFYRMLLPLTEVYPSVKRLTSGGEKFDAGLSEQLLSSFQNARMRNIYASTEAGTMLEGADDTFLIKDESLYRIVDNELYVHRSLLGEGDSALLVDDEWYHTGDLVEIIQENPKKVRFLHRKNEMINVGGYKVNPLEVEEIICMHHAVKQAFVYGKPNTLLGHILIADIVAEAGLTEKEIRTFLQSRLQLYKIPRIVNFVDNIRLTRSGKLKRT